MPKINKVFWVLAILVFLRLVTAPYPFDGAVPENTDHQTYLHYVQMIRDNGFVKWDQYWYGGITFLRFYPPLAPALAAFLPLGEVIAYKLVLLFFWAIAPITAYLMFKEFKMSKDGVLAATAIFSLTVFIAIRFSLSQMPTFVALPLGMMFLRHFIRFSRKNDRRDLFISVAFLSATILTHVLPAFLFLVISIIYLLSKKSTLKSKAKTALYCFLPAFLITSFWTVPYMLELPNSSSLENAKLTIFSPFEFFHDLYGYYFNYLALLATLMAVITLAIYLRNHRDKFVLYLFAAFFVIYFLTYNIFGGRVLILAGIPFAMMFASMMDRYRALVVVFIILEGILFVSYLFPAKTVDLGEETQIAEFLNGTAGRTMVIPAGTTYFGYVLPKYGVQAAHGGARDNLNAESVVFFEETLAMNLNCARTLGLSEVIGGIDLLSKRTAAADAECTFETANLSENLGKAYVKTVIVNNEYYKVKGFFDGSSDFNEIFSTKKYTVYSFLGKSDFVTPAAPYSRTATEINITGVQKGALSETWYPNWRAERYHLAMDQNGFIDFNGSGPLALQYTEPEFYDWLRFLSIISLAFTAYFALKPIKK